MAAAPPSPSQLPRLRRSIHKLSSSSSSSLYNPETDNNNVVSINVAVRCRPFSLSDKLALFISQPPSQQGEVRLLNLDSRSVRTTRYGFTYAWWSAFNYAKYLTQEQDIHLAEQMAVTTQLDVFENVGRTAIDDILTGHSVVMFAYGLSGSGKTYTVFGPDDPSKPEAWFNQPSPVDTWGLFPRMAHHLFQDHPRSDGQRVTVKYFQNVVNTVRDLLSSSGEEQSDKSGMHKDSAGFMDVTWCSKVAVSSWEALRKLIMAANRRKAIAPTQFNHQSTRGHCILVMEVETTNEALQKQKGRLYVCDLAGAEPAGDIVHALYQKNAQGDDVYKGPHPDARKTKALRAQGQKINLSLSEMTNFFRKMAKEAKANRLRPGQAIPGCNNYFLGRFLKETMLKSKTYLFCAVRPEAQYTGYSISTLQFAATASVVKLRPKKPLQRKMTPREKKLHQELEVLRAMLKQHDGQEANGGSLAFKIDEKRRELGEHALEPLSPAEKAIQERAKERQRRLRKRGITLMSDKRATLEPYLVNIDEDEFVSKRFLYYLGGQQGEAEGEDAAAIVFGVGGDVQPQVKGLVAGHCAFHADHPPAGPRRVRLRGGDGPVLHNGKDLAKGDEVVLVPHDRVAIGTLCLLYVDPASPGAEEPAAATIVAEHERGLEARNKGAAGKAFNPGLMSLQGKMHDLQELVGLFGRDDIVDLELYLDEDIDEEGLLYGGEFKCRARLGFGGGEPSPSPSSSPHLEWYSLDDDDLDRCVSILEQEKEAMKHAFDEGDIYAVPPEHDPVHLIVDTAQRLGYVAVDLGGGGLKHGAVLAPREGLPILALKKPHGTIGTLFAHLSYGVPGENADEGEGLGANALTVHMYRADLPVVVRQVSCRYRLGNESFYCEGAGGKGAHGGTDPDFDYSCSHEVGEDGLAQHRLLINLYGVGVPAATERLLPLSTQSPKVMRSFELRGIIGVSSDGTNVYDQIFQLKTEVKDTKRAVMKYKMKTAFLAQKMDKDAQRFKALNVRLKAEKQAAEDKAASLAGDRGALQARMEEAEAARTAAEEEHRAAMEDLATRHAETKAALARVKGEHARAERRAGEETTRLTKLLGAAKAEIEVLKGGHRDLSGRHDRVLGDLRRHKADQAEKEGMFQNALVAKASEIADLYGQLVNKNRQLEQAKSREKTLSADLDAHEAEVAKLREGKTKWLLSEHQHAVAAAMSRAGAGEEEAAQRKKYKRMEKELRLLKEKLSTSEKKRFDMERWVQHVEAKRKEAKRRTAKGKESAVRGRQDVPREGARAKQRSAPAAPKPKPKRAAAALLPKGVAAMVATLGIRTLEETFQAVSELKVQSSEEAAQVLGYVVDCALDAVGDGYAYTALLEKLLDRSVASVWQQQFVRTATVQGRAYWRDGDAGKTHGPFDDAVAALRNAVATTSPSRLLLKKCLAEFKGADQGFVGRVLKMVEILSSLFDHGLVPSGVMQNIVVRLMEQDIDGPSGGRIVSLVLEIIHRSVSKGEAGNVERTGKFIKGVEGVKGRLSSRDLFLLGKIKTFLSM